MQKHLTTAAKMQELGKKLALICPQKSIIHLKGELGAGKTTFTRGFLHGLGYQGKVKSPTFSIVEEYQLEDRELFHFDLYRIAGYQELELIGMRDYYSKASTILVEWPQMAQEYLPKPTIEITINILPEGREIFFKASDSQVKALLENI